MRCARLIGAGDLLRRPVLQSPAPHRVVAGAAARNSSNGERIKATGLRGYAAKESDLIFAVNWAQGRAYYWSRE